MDDGGHRPGQLHDERQATREAIKENLATYREDDGSYAAPAATWGVLAR